MGVARPARGGREALVLGLLLCVRVELCEVWLWLRLLLLLLVLHRQRRLGLLLLLLSRSK